MTKEDLKLIKAYQAWRRDDNNDPLTRLPNPTEIGIALDKMITYCKPTYYLVTYFVVSFSISYIF